MVRIPAGWRMPGERGAACLAYTSTRHSALPAREGPFCRSLGCSALPSLRRSAPLRGSSRMTKGSAERPSSVAPTPGTRGGTPWNERPSPANHHWGVRRYTCEPTVGIPLKFSEHTHRIRPVTFPRRSILPRRFPARILHQHSGCWCNIRAGELLLYCAPVSGERLR